MFTLLSTGFILLPSHNDIVAMFVFITLITTLFVYNTFLFFFTKDRAYFYYVLYLSSTLIANLTRTDMLQFYLVPKDYLALFTQLIPLIHGLFLLSIILFVREFLQTKKFPKLDAVLRIYLYFTPFIALLRCNEAVVQSPIMLLYIPLFFLLIFVGIYTFYKGHKEAKFYLLGWSFMLLAMVMLPLQKLGYIHMADEIPQLFKVAFLLEVFFFSIALAHKVKILREQHEATQKELIALQHDEQVRLEELVEVKTKDITLLLNQKEILFQELNHRVKNNLQMILSLLKLQIEKTSSLLTKEALQTTKNRISSIANLYENLHLDQNIYHLETQSYFESIVKNIQALNHKPIKVHYDISHNLNETNLFYAGLILNELVTNAYKYAFVHNGDLTIGLKRRNNVVQMSVTDNGIGFQKKAEDSLGLTIVQTLIEKQLLGSMKIESNENGIEGTSISLTWRENG